MAEVWGRLESDNGDGDDIVEAGDAIGANV
jgi:hypothetical protein